MHAVAQADIIFRNADFNEDGIPDNVGKLASTKILIIIFIESLKSSVYIV